MKNRRRNDSEALVDALTAAAIDRDLGECRSIVGQLGKGHGSSPQLVREARACHRRLRSVEQLRARIGLPPLGPSARAIAV
jgi:hypothetical protein